MHLFFFFEGGPVFMQWCAVITKRGQRDTKQWNPCKSGHGINPGNFPVQIGIGKEGEIKIPKQQKLGNPSIGALIIIHTAGRSSVCAYCIILFKNKPSPFAHPPPRGHGLQGVPVCATHFLWLMMYRLTKVVMLGIYKRRGLSTEG